MEKRHILALCAVVLSTIFILFAETINIFPVYIQAPILARLSHLPYFGDRYLVRHGLVTTTNRREFDPNLVNGLIHFKDGRFYIYCNSESLMRGDRVKLGSAHYTIKGFSNYRLTMVDDYHRVSYLSLKVIADLGPISTGNVLFRGNAEVAKWAYNIATTNFENIPLNDQSYYVAKFSSKNASGIQKKILDECGNSLNLLVNPSDRKWFIDRPMTEIIESIAIMYGLAPQERAIQETMTAQLSQELLNKFHIQDGTLCLKD